jgi:UDP-3-O-[3-hydroxymyristoyl] glucosamine N-acyltransferase
MHSWALVDTGVSIGSVTRVWALAPIASGAIVGHCNICGHTFIEGKERKGNHVQQWLIGRAQIEPIAAEIGKCTYVDYLRFLI